MKPHLEPSRYPSLPDKAQPAVGSESCMEASEMARMKRRQRGSGRSIEPRKIIAGAVSVYGRASHIVSKPSARRGEPAGVVDLRALSPGFPRNLGDPPISFRITASGLPDPPQALLRRDHAGREQIRSHGEGTEMQGTTGVSRDGWRKSELLIVPMKVENLLDGIHWREGAAYTHNHWRQRCLGPWAWKTSHGNNSG